MIATWAATLSAEKYFKKYGERKDLKKARRNKSEDFKITFKRNYYKRTSRVSFGIPHTPHLRVKDEIQHNDIHLFIYLFVYCKHIKQCAQPKELQRVKEKKQV